MAPTKVAAATKVAELKKQQEEALLALQAQEQEQPDSDAEESDSDAEEPDSDEEADSVVSDTEEADSDEEEEADSEEADSEEADSEEASSEEEEEEPVKAPPKASKPKAKAPAKAQATKPKAVKPQATKPKPKPQAKAQPEPKPRRAFVDPLEIKELILLGTKGGKTQAGKLLDRLSKQLGKVMAKMAKKKEAGPRKLSAYNVFTKQHMADVQDIESKLRMKELGQRWRALSDKEKAKYKKLAEATHATVKAA